MDTELKNYMNPRYIICAMIDSCFIDLDTLIGWADMNISRVDTPRDWLFSVSLATDLKDINDGIRCGLANENMLDHNLIDSLFIGFAYIRYKKGEINISELDKILSEYFVSDRALFNEDDLFTYFYKPNSNSQLVHDINLKFAEYESISRNAFEYFHNDKIIKALID
ncbi:hypothetical protein [Acinetobacter guillouiae]|uniref:hypothetical protein n=1 Tax=Acinetobacter TaxID=469 RepID=UPI001CD4D82F|nr:hypothetical protein [Acinetobacter guillouiae]